MVSAKNSRTKEKMHDLQLLECLTGYKKPCSSLTFLADVRSKLFQVKCLSKDSLRGLIIWWISKALQNQRKISL